MKQDDINLFEAYSQVVSSEREQLDEAGMLARAGARLGSLGGAIKQGFQSAMQGGGVGFKKSYQMGKQSSILSKLADETITNIQKLGLVPMNGKRFTPEDKNELVDLMSKFIEDRGGLSSTGQQGVALLNPKQDDTVLIGKNTYTYDENERKWNYAFVGSNGKPTGTTSEIKGGSDVQKKLTDAWRKNEEGKGKQYDPDFSTPSATSTPTTPAKPATRPATKPAAKPFRLKPSAKKTP
jgi:hypothetical protein